MKRFLLFAYVQYYPSGAHDLAGDFDTLERDAQADEAFGYPYFHFNEQPVQAVREHRSQ